MKTDLIWQTLRFLMSFLFLWAFFDKLFGFGFATIASKSWVHGISPTYGFLAYSKGTFSPLFHMLAGSQIVDWLFMMGLLMIGLSLLLGIGVKIAGYSGALFMFLLWLAAFPSANNPLIDEHIVYIIIFLGFTTLTTKNWFGFSNRWQKTEVVKKHTFLE